MLTADQFELLEKFRFNYPDDLDIAQQALAQSTSQRDALLVVDATYHAGQDTLMDDLDARLLAKAAALDALDLDASHVYVVHYGGTHPRMGGTVPTAWDVRYELTTLPWATAGTFETTGTVSQVEDAFGAPYIEGVDYTSSTVLGVTTLTSLLLPANVVVRFSPPLIVIVYSHSVNWDSDALTLQIEGGWTLYQTARFHPIWGTNTRAARITSGLANLQVKVDIVTGRENAAIALVASGHPILKRRKWETTKMVVTKQALVAIRSLDGLTTFTPAVDYNIVQDFPTLGQAQVFAKNPNVLPATVMLIGPA